MHKVIISHGKASIEYPFQDKKEAHEMYLRQCAHNAEECAMVGGQCNIRLQDEKGTTIAQTTISSNNTS